MEEEEVWSVAAEGAGTAPEV